MNGRNDNVDPLFERTINVKVSEEGPNLRLIGALDDLRNGAPLHGLAVDMLVCNNTGEIIDISGEMHTPPLKDCRHGPQTLSALKGHSVARGYRRLVNEKIATNRGCTHLAILLINMGNTYIQAAIASMRKNSGDKKEMGRIFMKHAENIGLVDSCIGWRVGGEAMAGWNPETGELDIPY